MARILKINFFKKRFNKSRVVLFIMMFSWLSALLILAYPNNAKAAIVLDGVNKVHTTAAGTTLRCDNTYFSAGDTLIILISTSSSSAVPRVSGISQTGATWNYATGITGGSQSTVEIWYAKNISGSASTAITVTMALSTNFACDNMAVSGLDPDDPLDKTATNGGTGTTVSTGTTATTSVANEFWVAALDALHYQLYTRSYSSWTNGFTGDSGQCAVTASSYNVACLGFGYKIVSSTATASTAATWGGASTAWSGAIATFKANAAPTKVVFTTAARTLTAGTCSGASYPITIQLQDASSVAAYPTGTTVINISSNTTGTDTFYTDSSCTNQISAGDITFTTSDHTKTFYMIDTRKSATTWTLTAHKSSGPDALTDGTQTYTLNAGSMTRLVVTMPTQTFTDGSGNSGSATNRTAGSSFSISKLSATDNYYNVVTSYSGSKTIAYSGPGNAPLGTAPSYTTSVSFTSGQSTTTLTTVLYDAETTTITATNLGWYGYASSSFTVDAGSVANYVVTATTPGTAGICVTAGNTIQARDQWNNNSSSDSSTVNMTSTGTAVTFYTTSGCSTGTTQYALSGGSVNFYFRTNKKQSGFTVTATKNLDSPTGTSGAITINPAAASMLLIKLPGLTFNDGVGFTGSSNFTGLRTPNATAGTAFSVDILACDPYYNLVNSGANNYTGTKTISFTNSVAGNSPSGTPPSFPGSSVSFTNGTASGLSITYYNAATVRTVRADDNVTPVMGPGSGQFTVQAAVVNRYGVSASSPQAAGVAFNVTITAQDTWWNPLGSFYTAPAGTYIWSTTAGNAPDSTAPVIGTLIQGNFSSGVATKSVTLYKAETPTFTASEPSPSTVTGTSSAMTVNAGYISANSSDSSVDAQSTIPQASYVPVTITLKDTWRNPVVNVDKSYITLTGTGSPTVVPPTSNTDANGQTAAWASWASLGTYVVSVQITTTLKQNDGSTNDADGFLDDTQSIEVTAPAGRTLLKGGSTIRGGTTL